MALTRLKNRGITDDTITEAKWGGGQFGRKNLIINGDMRIAQRGTSSVLLDTSNIYYNVDRFLYNIDENLLSIANTQQNLNSITPPPSFTNYLGVVINTGTSTSTDDYYNIRQQIEGYNATCCGFGTSDAKTVTASFWVRASITGIYPFSLRNGGSDRSYVSTYTINSANTWEYKTITINGDTSGTWLTTDGVGITLNFGLGNSNGTFAVASGDLNTWVDGSKTGYTGQVDLVETTGATWYITGVQLEVGSVATPFEHRSYGEELALCQRYYFDSNPGATTAVGFVGMPIIAAPTIAEGNAKFAQQMRSAPSISFKTTNPGQSGIGNYSSTAGYISTEGFARASNTVQNWSTNGTPVTGSFTADAEL